MMCGFNQFHCSEAELLAGMNRFGLDNPTPIITRRLAHYGNEETVEKILEKCFKQYNDRNFFDNERFGGVYPDKNMVKGLEGAIPKILDKSKAYRDMGETIKIKRAGKKISCVRNINILDKLDNAKKYESPANFILARNITVRIKDIPKRTTIRGHTPDLPLETNIEPDI